MLDEEQLPEGGHQRPRNEHVGRAGHSGVVISF